MAKAQMMATSTHIAPDGRVVIPTRIRKQAGLSGEEALVVWVEDDRIILRRREQVEEELWRQFEGVKKSLSSDLIADRRREARREAKKKRL